MTEWTDYRVEIAEQIEQTLLDRWSDLWKFNGGVEPKFWFGDRVKFQERSGEVIGMEWLDTNRAYRYHTKEGWSYTVRLTEGCTQCFHEGGLKATQTEGEK